MVEKVDKDLLVGCRNRDKKAFTKLCKTYERYLFTLCLSYAGNSHDALDLVQEIFIKVFRFIDKYDINKPFHPWIRKIAVNTCLNFRRATSNVLSIHAVTDNSSAWADMLVSNENLEDEIEKIELKKTMKQLLEKLPPRQRMVIVLRYFEDLTYNEISMVMNEPLGTVKTDLYRARSALKQFFVQRQGV
ncbi:RNA polymerase sigma factor [Lutispora thermophila]|uniref:RNA polymerase sigma-70 factor, ECF subfamily n=1 Tax=Lutispora thermophila DSM 19022 TaxID=1122184 RepID=A0A1M6CJ19_9FIRM|nr:RNA polymerase sigma factor [Lutispora thermophila]SHI60744.1 RNA polymerase sigma-70 factor, ECF subfamily [Lutispora thermophila DSM 19022]